MPNATQLNVTGYREGALYIATATLPPSPLSGGERQYSTCATMTCKSRQPGAVEADSLFLFSGFTVSIWDYRTNKIVSKSPD
jgi:hypothetical protein